MKKAIVLLAVVFLQYHAVLCGVEPIFYLEEDDDTYVEEICCECGCSCDCDCDCDCCEDIDDVDQEEAA